MLRCKKMDKTEIRRFAPMPVRLLLLAGCMSVVSPSISEASDTWEWTDAIQSRADAEWLEELESERALVTCGQSVTDEGITVTLKEAVVDQAYAFLTFGIEGVTVGEDQTPSFGLEDIMFTGDTTALFDCDYRGYFCINGSELYSDREALGTEDGSLEYCMEINNTEGIILDNIGIRIELKSFRPDSGWQDAVDGTWVFTVTLPESLEGRTYELNTEVGDTGWTILAADLSLCSGKISLESKDTESDWIPELVSMQLQDGAEIFVLNGDGTSAEGEWYWELIFDRFVDVNQIAYLEFMGTDGDSVLIPVG